MKPKHKIFKLLFGQKCTKYETCANCTCVIFCTFLTVTSLPFKKIKNYIDEDRLHKMIFYFHIFSHMTRSDILFKHLWAGTVTILRMTIRTMVHFYIKYMKPIKRRIICSNFSQKYQLLSVIHVSIIAYIPTHMNLSEVINPILRQTQLSMKFIMLTNVKMPQFLALSFISMMNTTTTSW